MLRAFATRFISAAAAAAGMASGASALLIDDFGTAQTVTATVIAPETFNSVQGSGILGGERDGYLALTAGASMAVNVTSGSALIAKAPASDGQLWFEWDGLDNTPVIGQTGLGGIDLTEGGTQDAFSVQILLNTQATASLGFLVHTDANNYSIIQFAAPAGASTQTIRFADFSALAGSGAEFTNIGALSFFSDVGVPGENIQFGTFQTILVPEPSTGLLVALGALGLAGRCTSRAHRS